MRPLSENPTETCLIRTHLGRRSAVPSDNLHEEKNLKNTEAALARAFPIFQLGGKCLDRPHETSNSKLADCNLYGITYLRA